VAGRTPGEIPTARRRRRLRRSTNTRRPAYDAGGERKMTREIAGAR
jgi:hypothetical protein